MKSTVFAALLASTALVSPMALAQDQANERAAMDGACAQLATLAESEDFDANDVTAEQAAQIAENGEAQVCADIVRVAEGDISTVEGEQNYDADATARIQVAVPQPDVTVTQDAPQVDVAQPQPEVNVSPGRPQVTVNQAEPVVRVEMTPPTISIDMPKPEILVEVPDPTVNVTMAEPRVSVSQPDPNVRVEQGEVRMQVGEQTAESATEGADVAVEQSEPVVELEEAEAAEVTTEDVTPRVTFNAAEPRIEMGEMGEPQISFNQTGEANVRVRQMSADETRAAAEGNMDETETDAAAMDPAEDAREPADMATTDAMTDEAGSNTETTADAEMDRETDTGEMETAAATGTETGTQSNAMTATQSDAATGGDDRTMMQANELEGLLVIGSDGEDIGDIEYVVTEGGEVYVIVGSGGFLGLAERQILIEASTLRRNGDQLVASEVTRDGVGDMDDVDVDNYTQLATSQMVEIAAN